MGRMYFETPGIFLYGIRKDFNGYFDEKSPCFFSDFVLILTCATPLSLVDIKRDTQAWLLSNMVKKEEKTQNQKSTISCLPR